MLTLGIQWTSVHTVQQYAQCCEFSNSVTRLLLPEALTQRNTQFLGIPRRLVLLVNDPACYDYSDVRRWKCAIYRLGVVLSISLTAYINHTMIKVLLKYHSFVVHCEHCCTGNKSVNSGIRWNLSHKWGCTRANSCRENISLMKLQLQSNS